MRLAVGLFLLCAGLCCAQAQSAFKPAALVPVTIDGAVHPEQIPDSLALRFVLLSLSLPANPTSVDLKKQELRLRRIPMSNNDKQILTRIAKDFGRDFKQWQSALVPSENLSSDILAQEVSERDALVARYKANLSSSLSSQGSAGFAAYLLLEKAKMTAFQ